MQAPGDSVTAVPPLGSPRAQVSIILPVHNAECWLDDCLRSVLHQDFEGTMELSVFNDASKDKSMTVIEKWKVKLEDSGILVVIGGHDSPSPRGVGYSKNQAIAQSSGAYLCFLDAIIGCQVRRDPPDSTERYTHWINQLSADQLLTQVFTSNGPTVIMPTWFCSRAWFSHVGWFDEGGQKTLQCLVDREFPKSAAKDVLSVFKSKGLTLMTKGVPEDLLFFQEHLRRGGRVVRVERRLLLYRYHPGAASLSVLEGTIWTLRVRFLEERVLPHWAAFTIWNAGKQGRRLYRSLEAANRQKVVAFCDVDERKIKKGFYCYEDAQERPKPRVPILHFRAAQPPFIICVKLQRVLPSMGMHLILPRFAVVSPVSVWEFPVYSGPPWTFVL
ncbi:UDP-GlcNAc:betaGal beta-1,3-N-acetylglucosaminyltransferase-like protein 1 isoform X3 [Loxodonta africana]|uniref:UDP-GlcNAc:betaGal beta-1,3-N-acetylglucosaminyltransferase-like protein 1 isoform X3 n=1 Tax=Loxodonta africana TaxID=9785 RepID=UPI0030CFCC80